ncbi:Aerobic cobaltochelatase CobN subunit [hydrothermal vent metagenome]|uniref:Aerobic cobaltochelatase CobN subunit n=1 Tax=hydrothermal vent metagenome TaxID=652676 RepID=A0A3B1D5W6_9ZZZZ
MKKIKTVVFNATGTGMISMAGAVRRIEDEFPGRMEVQARTNDDLFDSRMMDRFTHHLQTADCVIVILHGGRKSFRFFDRLIEESRNAFVFIQPGDEDEMSLSARHSTEYGSDFFDEMVRFIKFGGEENWTNLLRSLIKRFSGEDIPYDPPQKMPSEGIYHPRTGVSLTLDEYMNSQGTSLKELEDKKTPIIGMWFYQGYYVDGNLAFVDSLVNEIERQGCFPIACFYNRFPDRILNNRDPEWVAENFFQVDGKTVIHVLLSCMVFSMRLTLPKFAGVYEKIGVPVLQAITLFTTRRNWEETEQGATPLDVCISAAQPEFDGILITVPVSTRDAAGQDLLTGATLLRNMPVEERIGKIVSLAGKWAMLGIKPNAEKRVAVIFHNYPPRNDRIGCAAGLDSFKSVKNILDRLKQEGYSIEREYESGDALAHEILDRVTADRRWLTPEAMAQKAADRIGPAQYSAWHEGLAEKNREHMVRDWGEIPGGLFVHEDEVMVNGIINGNVYIGIQPPRGFVEQPEKIHDPHLAPSHHYIFHYRWIRDVFKADAVLHIGKHGSLEWLPGKSLALSQECYPDISIMDLPNIYPYIINDPGEGTQAKRRSYACVVDHLIPVMTNADRYDELAEVDTKILEYIQTKSMNPERLPVLQKEIWQLAAKQNLHSDMEVSEDEAFSDFDAFVERLHSWLSEVADTAINDGLHVMGFVPEGEGLAELVTQLVRIKNGDVPSLREAIAGQWGYDYDNLLQYRGQADPTGRFPTNAVAITEIHRTALEIVMDVIEGREPRTADESPEVRRVVEFIRDVVLPKLEQTTEEIDSVVAALSGRHVLPGGSGAPTRGMVDILPTGRNFFSVDPFRIPSPTAWITGKALGDALVERHMNETGKPPESIGMVIWGSPTMRTMGEDIAEAFYLMGVRPVWNSRNGRIEGLEIIPVGELKFPRVDVTFRTSGFFRDSFPNLMELLDEAVAMVTALEEPVGKNFLRKHVLTEAEELVKRGIDPEEALREASFRIFSDPPGVYGAGIPAAIDAKAWEKSEDLGEVYITWGGYAYGKGVYGEDRRDVFRRRLSDISLVVKNEDSREYDLLSSDDFNAYFGGFVAAVKTVSGNYPKAYSGDASDPDRVRYRSIQEEVKHVFRSRILNPKWMDGLMRHGYKGAGDLSRAVDISFHWDATSDVMEDWMYDALSEKYALDEKMQEWFKEVNPYALQNIAERLLEAASRGMWNASEEMKKRLEDMYLDVEGDIEERTDA